MLGAIAGTEVLLEGWEGFEKSASIRLAAR